MKKITISCSIVILSLLLLASCGKKPAAKDLTLELKENPSTGYTLTYEIADESIATVKSDEFKSDDTGKTGAGEIHSYVIGGLKEGETTITFTPIQDWDGGDKGEEQVITVIVDKDLNVTKK